jgi:NSS family neurotransmitter:Na+ symporter
MAETRAQWSSRLGFILAAAGSAVGLGNIWKFPYITGENGGGLFVIIYLVCIALVGIPIMMAEIMIGRVAQRQPVGAFEVLQGRRTAWSIIGWMGVIGGFVILSFYVVVAGWALDYCLKSVVNFTEPIHQRADAEATAYRATTPIDEMRLALVERRTAHEFRPIRQDLRAELPPSVWRNWEQFQTAMAAASNSAEAERRLLLDDEMREAVEHVRAHQPKMDAAEAELREAARVEVGAMPETEVLENAEDLHRRNLIAAAVGSAFGSVASDGWMSTMWAAVFMFITIVIVARGISGGIEVACKIMMPTLIVLMVCIVLYGMTKSGFGEAMRFVFKPDVHKLKASGVLEALGHAFFTLSLGMGAMITYGSYQRSTRGLAGESVSIAVIDTIVALLACMMIFPIIFSYDQDPAAGPGLVFMSMPLAFAEIGQGGMLLAIMFFGLLFFAALTSSISLLEVVASYFIDQQGWSRSRAAWVLGGTIFLLAIICSFSMDPDFFMTGWMASYGANFFDVMDYLTSNWMLPLGGLLIAIYAGWVMPRRLQRAQVEGLATGLFAGWLLLVRFIAPALVVIVLLQKVGILDADELFHRLLH